jgi:hypothetical protein
MEKADGEKSELDRRTAMSKVKLGISLLVIGVIGFLAIYSIRARY